jgi:hypothetical protein
MAKQRETANRDVGLRHKCCYEVTGLRISQCAALLAAGNGAHIRSHPMLSDTLRLRFTLSTEAFIGPDCQATPTRLQTQNQPYPIQM